MRRPCLHLFFVYPSQLGFWAGNQYVPWVPELLAAVAGVREEEQLSISQWQELPHSCPAPRLAGRGSCLSPSKEGIYKDSIPVGLWGLELGLGIRTL